MNKQSSRSHAIFTITLEQRRLLPERPAPPAAGEQDTSSSGEDDEDDDEEDEPGANDDSYLCAKMHLVDLAGWFAARQADKLDGWIAGYAAMLRAAGLSVAC